MRRHERSGLSGWVVMAAMAMGWLASDAQAQCTDAACNQANEHWSFNPVITSGSDELIIGMFKATASTGRWYPMACRKDGSSWIPWQADGHPGFTSNALQADTSICTEAGNDKITVLGMGKKHECSVLGGKVVVEGFDPNGHTLKISGGDGNDTINFSGWGGAGFLCGGAGNDKLIGTQMTQIMFGGSGADGMDGWGQLDSHSGGSGNDVMRHVTSGTDLLRGDTENDCVDISNVMYASTSSCDAGSDLHAYYNIDCSEIPCLDPPSSCQTMVPLGDNCCDLSGRTCPIIE